MPTQRASSKRNAHQHHANSPPYTPSPDANTYRDLLIFEERLKQNAARLHARKQKYESLLAVFVCFILFLSYHTFIDRKESVPLHYFILSLLLICLTTLFLFFASGMHAERIRAANKFVPQANRSLRSFNMYLNTRVQPRRRSFFPFSYLFSSKAATGSGSVGTTTSRGAAATPSHGSAHGGSAAPRRSAIPPIPPAQNPRGELIFSTKVSSDFRDGYERYRAAFERRRAEKMMAKRARSWKRWIDLALAPFSGRSAAGGPAGSANSTAQDGTRGSGSPRMGQGEVRRKKVSNSTASAALAGARKARVRKESHAPSIGSSDGDAASGIDSTAAMSVGSDADSPPSSTPGTPDMDRSGSGQSSADEGTSSLPAAPLPEDELADAAKVERQLGDGGPPPRGRAAQIGSEWIQVKRSGSRSRVGRSSQLPLPEQRSRNADVL